MFFLCHQKRVENAHEKLTDGKSKKKKKVGQKTIIKMKRHKNMEQTKTDGNIPEFIALVKKLEKKKPNNKYLCEIRMATGRFNGERPLHNPTGENEETV